MGGKWLGIYGGFFVLMLAIALVVSGVFRQGILPRIWGLWPGGGRSGEVVEEAAGGPAAPKEGQGVTAKPGEPPRAGEQAEAPSAGQGSTGSEPPRVSPSDAVRQARESVPVSTTGASESARAGEGVRRVEEIPGPAKESQPGRARGGIIPAPVSARESPAQPVEPVRRLARVYEGMRAKEAAIVIEKLERSLAVKVLGEIRERQAAKILGAMNPAAAADLSRLLGQPTGGETP